MPSVVVVWVAIALTGWGPIVGRFDDERDCRQAVELAKVCSNVLRVAKFADGSECQRADDRP